MVLDAPEQHSTKFVRARLPTSAIVKHPARLRLDDPIYHQRPPVGRENIQYLTELRELDQGMRRISLRREISHRVSREQLSCVGMAREVLARKTE